MSKEDIDETFNAFMAYNAELAKAGVLRAGGQLQPSHTATTLRAKDGKVAMTDGPFAETKEQMGGYYIVEVDNLDDALTWAKRCPILFGSGGVIEVRPVGTVPAELQGE
ncbi:MAG: YciI family protein [Myxococcota bacterium]